MPQLLSVTDPHLRFHPRVESVGFTCARVSTDGVIHRKFYGKSETGLEKLLARVDGLAEAAKWHVVFAARLHDGKIIITDRTFLQNSKKGGSQC